MTSSLGGNGSWRCVATYIASSIDRSRVLSEQIYGGRPGATLYFRESDRTCPYKNVCLVKTFRALKISVPYTGDGPFWALADGNIMLRPFGLRLRVVEDSVLQPGRYVAYKNEHFQALFVFEDGLSCVLDGAHGNLCVPVEIAMQRYE